MGHCVRQTLNFQRNIGRYWYIGNDNLKMEQKDENHSKLKALVLLSLKKIVTDLLSVSAIEGSLLPRPRCPGSEKWI